jgi:hypothetical protein
MPHDFFTEQPVKNAYLYYIRRCLHNWTDAHVAQIIGAIAPAMAKDSKLLIAEMVVPEVQEKERVDGDKTVYWMDHTMMTVGGRERTVNDFEALLDGAGLRLLKVWMADSGSQAGLEAELKT